MIISINGIRQFRRCQRQWCYDALVASAHAKHGSPRREVHLLSQLQSVAAWRGNIVDHVISRRLIPALEKGWDIRPAALLDYAHLGPSVSGPVSLRDVLNRALSTLRPHYHEGAHRLRVDLAPRAEWVRGNPLVVEQIFVSLLLNCVEASSAPR